MSVESIRLAELLCARLCHDLAGPAGAIANGAELMGEDDPGMAQEAAALMAGAASQLSNRLRFFRAAFGWEGGAAKDLAEAGRIAADFLAPLPGQPPRIVLEGPTGTDPGPGGLKLLHILTLLGSEALPRGGRLTLTAAPQILSVLAEGQGANLSHETAALLQNQAEAPHPAPRTAPVLFARALARETGWTLSAEATPGGLNLAARAGRLKSKPFSGFD